MLNIAIIYTIGETHPKIIAGETDTFDEWQDVPKLCAIRKDVDDTAKKANIF